MDSIHPDNSTTSSDEEVDDQPPEHDSIYVATGGRSYECVFCKRGFSTAQALGGHMNIHRKDRARARPGSTSPHSLGELYSNPGSFQHVPSRPPEFPWEAQVGLRTHFPASTSAARPAAYAASQMGNLGDQSQQGLNLSPFGDDCRVSMSLSLSFGPLDVEDKEKKRAVGSEEEDGLDLELRLGCNP